jgi:predicted RNA binding protein YcfA (HicA-like mRNA interferase family)
MGKSFDKLRDRICSIPSDLTYDELRRFLSQLGFIEYSKGATSGSRVQFYHPEKENELIQLHKPHPGNIVGRATLRDIVAKLKEWGEIS